MKEAGFVFFGHIKEGQSFKARNAYSLLESSRAGEVLPPQGQIPH